jgi:cellulose synthase/poly-beta-1,6-N-acetylglucosamine synthase-like glycosyltransferase
MIAAELAINHLMRSVIDCLEYAKYLQLAEATLLTLIFTLMMYGNVIYLAATLGFERLSAPSRVMFESRNDGGTAYAEPNTDELLTLIPAYKEEWHVVFKTIMSAALVEYPSRMVALLIDDPPTPVDAADECRLRTLRDLPRYMQNLFAGPAQLFEHAQAAYHQRAESKLDFREEARELGRLYDRAAEWLEGQAQEFVRRTVSVTHGDQLFLDRILREPSRSYRRRATELITKTPTSASTAQEYARLAGLFRVKFVSFERKRYVNLSHIPNKAMNLNSYIGLFNQHCREVLQPEGLYIEPAPAPDATLHFPDPEFVIVLDADSLITSDYALRLVQVMRRPGNERLAIAQCPYTAIPAAPGILECTASATTDVQYFNHHGMAYYGGTFWVGAAALIRRAALEEIATEREERGHPVKIFIHDRILIEDAAATIDLLNHGWRIYHDLQRLSFSETPPDFGALVIQRRRWANGGLLILPKLLRYTLRRPFSLQRLRETAIRLPTLVSAAISGVCVPILLFVPFDDDLVTSWMPAAGLPYFLIYGRDLLRAGYRLSDLLRVQALNLLLIPVLIAGTVQSLRQAWSGQPVAFRRTPKTANRTAAPPIFITAPCSMVLYAGSIAVWDAFVGEYWHLAFSISNGLLMMYAIVRFIGMKELGEGLIVVLGPQLKAARGRILGSEPVLAHNHRSGA